MGGGRAVVAPERNSVESLVKGLPASQTGPRADGRREEKESMSEWRLLKEGHVGVEFAMKGNGRSGPAYLDTTSALWTPTLEHASEVSTEGDQRAMMNPEEESRPRKANGDAL